jgi:hypothetical protein
LTVALVVVLVGFSLISRELSKPAHAQTGCSVASLNGPYGVVGSGFIGGAPTTFVGTFVYDGAGKSTGSIVLNVSGGIDHIGDIAGTYNIDGSCNGSQVIHTVHHSPPVSHYHDMDIVVVDGGREALFQVGSPKDSESGKPPPGEVLSGVLKRL